MSVTDVSLTSYSEQINLWMGLPSLYAGMGVWLGGCAAQPHSVSHLPLLSPPRGESRG